MTTSGDNGAAGATGGTGPAGSTGAGPTGAGAAGAATAGATGAADANISMPKDQFDKRLEQAKRSALKELFGDADPTEAMKELGDLRTAKAKADRDALTEKQRIESDLAAAAAAKSKAEGEAQTAKQEAERARFEASVSKACAKLGIANFDYAMFLVGSRKNEEGFDVAKLLGELSKDAAHKAALGVAGLATTTPEGTGALGATGATGATGSTGNIATMSPEEWAKEKSKYGL